ncbi:hypothetical protein Tco_1346397 [Tanacetum coccineum]
MTPLPGRGTNMNRISSWNVLIDRFKNRLSGWKANMLSSGGRLTLIKSVLGSLGDTKKLAWIKWSTILVSLDKGGLGVGSLKAFNISLLLKWRCRLLKSPSALWVKVLKAIKATKQMVGDGNMVRFWKDTWLGDSPLCYHFNRLFRLEKNQNCLIRERIDNGHWMWDWSIPVNGGRSQADFNNLLVKIGALNIEVDSDCVVSSLSSDGSYSVNIFLWRMFLDRLPHRINLSSRGLDLDLILCPDFEVDVAQSPRIFCYGLLGVGLGCEVRVEVGGLGFMDGGGGGVVWGGGLWVCGCWGSSGEGCGGGRDVVWVGGGGVGIVGG